MATIKVSLNTDLTSRLADLAAAERRATSEQAAVLLEKAVRRLPPPRRLDPAAPDQR